MSKYYGDFLTSKTVRCRFNSIDATGAPASLSSGAVITTKDGADATPSGGVTLSSDVGGVTGRNHVVIDMSVDTATFTAGAEYSVRLSGSSNVGGTSVVGIVVGEWSVENRSVAVDSSGRTLLQPTQSGVTIPTVTNLTNAPTGSGSDPWITDLSAAVIAGTYTGYQAGALAATALLPDGTIASATATTITLPAATSTAFPIPDDGRYRNFQLRIVAGTGAGQDVVLTTPAGSPREYNVLAATMPVQLDSTSQFQFPGSVAAELDLAQPVPTSNTAQTVGDKLNRVTDDSGSNLVGTGTVMSAVSKSQFGVTFDASYTGNQAALTDGTLYLSFTSGLNQWHSQKITGGTLASPTAATLSFLVPFGQNVANGDTFAIVSN
jgi:hypothetical protein